MEQSFLMIYSPYVKGSNLNRPFKRPYEGQYSTRDISMFVESLRDLHIEDMVKISDMTIYVSSVVNIKGRQVASYRFIIESNEKKEVKEITEKLTEYFTSKGAEIR